MGRVNEITRAVKRYDSLLYAQETHRGRIDIYRKSQFGCNPPHLVLSLTDTWSVHGTPREWGIEVILDRLRANDLWRDDSFVENFIKDQEKHAESKERARRNNLEGFLGEMHSSFKKHTGDINTALMDKKMGGLYGHR